LLSLSQISGHREKITKSRLWSEARPDHLAKRQVQVAPSIQGVGLAIICALHNNMKFQHKKQMHMPLRIATD
jgi:hypothetical protein